MEIMDSPQASGSIGKDKESNPKHFVINIPPNLPHVEWPDQCCIYRVPKKLRKVNKEAYTPKFVSIGPFHHGRKELRDMEKLKLKYLKEFLNRTMQIQENLLEFILEKEEKIRRCYSEECRLKREDFVKMIPLDAIFIIELFWRTKYDRRDYILNKPWLVNGIQHDLLLLENQLPFFVLKKLCGFAFNDSTTTFLELSLNYFDSCGKQKPEFNYKEAKHLTDLIRYFFIVPDLKPTKYLKNLYSATKLDDAGLKFKKVEVEERCLLEIKLHQNRFLGRFRCFDCSWLLACLPCLKCFPCLERRQCFLEVPQFEIDDDTEAIFRNLMALEQCHYPVDTYICNYILLLDHLIDTKQDVDLLVDEKVILNNIGSNDAVVTLINKLGLQIVETRSCYYDLAQKLNQHYEHPWNRILATLTSVYFRDFWRGSATVVGLIVLCFTFWNFLKPFVI